jgi:hypothetical protein
MTRDPALDEAILDSELRHPHLFNGRLLSSGVLQSERQAQHAHARHLGRAVGGGVAWGLEAALASDSTPTQPVALVTAGLAVNLAGRTLRLECDQRVSLLRSVDPAAKDTCVFADCGPSVSGATQASGFGFFLLTLAPASRSEGRAPVSGLGTGLAPCNYDSDVEGVCFRLLALSPKDPALMLPPPNAPERRDSAALARLGQRLRHRLAWRCLGFGANLFSHYLSDPLHLEIAEYGALEESIPAEPRRGEVPLAVLCWLEEGLQFLDMWAVRRRIIHAEAGPRFAPLVGVRRLAEAEAALHQFQDQLDTLTGPEAKDFQARDVFELLPGGGFLATGPDGFVPDNFFAGMSFERVSEDPAWLRALVRASLDLEPIVVPAHGVAGPHHVRVVSFGDSPFVFFVRAPQPTIVPEPPPPSAPDPTREKSSVLVTVQLPIVVTGRAARVVAQNARGETFEGQLTSRSDARTYLGGGLLAMKAASTTTSISGSSKFIKEALTASQPPSASITVPTSFVFLIPNLEPGAYVVKAFAPLCNTKSVTCSLAPGERSTLNVALELKIDVPAPGLPDRPIIVSPRPWPKWPPSGPVDPRPPREIIDDPSWYERMPSPPILLEQPIRDRVGHAFRKIVITPEVEVGPKVDDIAANWTRIEPGNLDATTRAQIDTALTKMLTAQPGAPITTDQWTLFLDPAHNPAAPGAEPYSYLKMGHGPALATVLVPEESALPAEYPATRANVPELSAERFASSLAGSSFASMDVLGSAWGGARAALLGMPVENAAATGRALLAAASQARADFAYVPGLNAQDSAKIKSKGLDAAGLANASAADLATAGDAADLEHWDRIIAQYRAYVPNTTWHVDAAELNLKATERAVLADKHVDSLGALSRSLEDPTFVAQLGWTEMHVADAKRKLGEKLGIAHARLGQERALGAVLAPDAAPFTGRLAAQGIDTVAKLADADPAALARQLGLDQDDVAQMVKDALIATVQDKTGLAADAAQQLVSKSKANSLADLEALPAENLNKILKDTSAVTRVSAALTRVRSTLLR